MLDNRIAQQVGESPSSVTVRPHTLTPRSIRMNIRSMGSQKTDRLIGTTLCLSSVRGASTSATHRWASSRANGFRPGNTGVEILTRALAIPAEAVPQAALACTVSS